MENIKYIPPGRLSGKISLPASKSITHRLLVMAALSGKPCTIRNPLLSDDTEITLNGLTQLGYRFRRASGTIVFSDEQQTPAQSVEIWLGDSGSSARFLTAIAALQPFEVRLDGSPRLRQRPMGELFRALRNLGAETTPQKNSLPVTVRGGRLTASQVEIGVSQTSQFLSALLLIAPALPDGLKINCCGEIVSRSYVDLTVAFMKHAGVPLEILPGEFVVPAQSRYRLNDVTVESDWSAAAYFLTGAALSGGEIEIDGLNAGSAQGDRQILNILQAAGASIEIQNQTVLVRNNGLQAVDWDMNSCPDLVPTVAVLALFAPGTSHLRNVAHLRFKESDRIAAVLENIKRLNGKAFLQGDDLVIEPAKLKPAVLNSFNDHRIAMSFALTGLRLPGVEVENPGCVGKSFPGFWELFESCIRSDLGDKSSEVDRGKLHPLYDLSKDETRNRIVLIGFRGVGKTTVGKELADLLGWKYLSTDALIIKQTGSSITDFVRENGWIAFRQVEREVIAGLKNVEQTIIDCGGGVVENRQNMEILAQHSWVVWVDADVKEIYRRLGQANDRPLLEQPDLMSDVESKYFSRLPLYQKYSQIKVDSSQEPVEKICQQILGIVL